MARTVEEVLREMDAAAINGYLPNDPGATLRGWLEVLRPVVARGMGNAHVTEPLPSSNPFWYTEPDPLAEPDVETFPIKSGLPQRLLRDLGVTIELRTDHEATGEIRIDYSKAPPEHRLQALLSVMGAVGDRIAYAIGNESYVNLLRGIVARREREG